MHFIGGISKSIEDGQSGVRKLSPVTRWLPCAGVQVQVLAVHDAEPQPASEDLPPAETQQPARQRRQSLGEEFAEFYEH